jgi:hypothetical protein
MNNCSSPTCTVNTVQIGPWFLLNLDVTIPRGLAIKNHAEFSFQRPFAGLSGGGKPLSCKATTGPAAIGPVPLRPEKPRGWIALPRFGFDAKAGLLAVTDKPRIAFFGIANVGWHDDCTCLCIHPNDLAPIVEIPSERTEPRRTDVTIDKLTPDVANLLVRHSKELKVVILGQRNTHEGVTASLLASIQDDRNPWVRVPASLRLSSAEWGVLKRYLFTGHSYGTVSETTTIGEDDECFRLPGHSVDEVKAKWGVDCGTPSFYDGENLLFKSLDVLQEGKLGRLFPNAVNLRSRRLQSVERRWLNESGYDLCQAYAAGILPAEGVLQVTADLTRIYLPEKDLRIEQFKQPVVVPTNVREDSAVVCPPDLIPKFLVPARRAVRDRVIPRTVTSYCVRTQKVTGPSDADPPGTFYLISDLCNLPSRNLKQERAERLAREKRLRERYGTALPHNYETLTDEQIECSFTVQALIETGEIIEAERHPLLPTSYRVMGIVRWLQKEAPHLVVVCPVTNKVYVRQVGSMEDLADIPGFWQAVESALGEGPWLRKLIISPKVQTAALISAI